MPMTIRLGVMDPDGRTGIGYPCRGDEHEEDGCYTYDVGETA